MAVTVAPNALYGIYKQIKPYLKSMKIGGVVGDDAHARTGGYHISRDVLRAKGFTSDYSIQARADKRGEGRYAAGIDITLSDAEMKVVTKRLLAACTPDADGNYDPRIEPVREIIGTVDGRNVCGYNRVSTGSGSRSRVGLVKTGYSSSSHLWHDHVSVLRDYVDDVNAMTGVAEVIAGVPAGAFGWKGATVKPVPAPAPVLPTLYVDPAKVSTFLWGIDHETGGAAKQRIPGDGWQLDDYTVIDFGGRKWALSEAGYRYALDYLTTQKPPTPAPPAPLPEPEPPMTLETVATFNLRREAADRPGFEWDRRAATAVAAIKASGATVVGLQECENDMGAEVAAALGGWLRFEYHNVEVQADPKTWSLEHDNGYTVLAAGEEDYVAVVVLKHRETGREFKVGCVHLPARESDEVRLKLFARALTVIVGLDIVLGDFNSSKQVFDLAEEFGFRDPRRVLSADRVHGENLNTTHHFLSAKRDGRWIDNILTRGGVKLDELRVLRTDPDGAFPNASDHHLLALTLAVD